jgi:hypothetical protein
VNIKNAFIGLVLLGVVAGIGFIAYQHFIMPNQACDICGRPIHAAHEAVVLRKDGGKVHNCCPRCALHYEINHPAAVEGLLVTDRITGERIDARQAFYIEGGDEPSCLMPSETPPREPGTEFSRVFDRCLPSLVAFRETEDARRYMSVHGGRLLTYEQAVESVKTL